MQSSAFVSSVFVCSFIFLWLFLWPTVDEWNGAHLSVGIHITLPAFLCMCTRSTQQQGTRTEDRHSILFKYKLLGLRLIYWLSVFTQVAYVAGLVLSKSRDRRTVYEHTLWGALNFDPLSVNCPFIPSAMQKLYEVIFWIQKQEILGNLISICNEKQVMISYWYHVKNTQIIPINQ